MKWLNRLKMESAKKSIFGLILFVGAAVVLTVLTKWYGVFGMLMPRTLDELTPETMNGAFVDDDIYFIYTPYLEIERYQNNRKIGTTGMQYLVDFDEDYFMGLYVHAGKAMDEAEEMADACEKVWDGKLDLDDLPVLHVRGVIRAMDDDDLDYYMELPASGEEEYFLPYYLEVDYVYNIPIWGCIALLAVTLLLLGLGLWPMVKALTGGFQKQVRAKLTEEGGGLERQAEQAERFYDSTPEVSGVRMGDEYVFFQNGAESILLRPWDVAWAYQSTTQHRTNGVPSGKSFAAVLRTMDGKTYTLSLSEKKVQELLTAMSTALPGVVLGYDKQIEQIYNQNRDMFRQRWDEKRAEKAQEPDQGAETLF